MSVSTYRTQILFPVSDGYVSVSPVASAAVISALYARIQQRVWNSGKAGKELINTRTTHVGGTKPQNAGFLSSEMGGRFPKLLSFPPEISPRNSKDVLKAFMRRGLTPYGGKPTKQSLDAFASATYRHHIRPNDLSTEAFQEAIRALCLDIASDLQTVAGENDFCIASTGKPVATLDALPADSQEIGRIIGLPPTSGVKPDGCGEEFALGVATEIARSVAQQISGRLLAYPDGRRKLEIDDYLRDRIRGAAFQLVQEFTR